MYRGVVSGGVAVVWTAPEVRKGVAEPLGVAVEPAGERERPRDASFDELQAPAKAKRRSAPRSQRMAAFRR